MNKAVLAGFMAVGAGGFFLPEFGITKFFKSLFGDSPQIDAKATAILIFLVLLCISYTQADAVWSRLAFDTELYHAEIVNWNKAYAAVPGLAQLNVRLGTDSSFLLLASVFDHWIWEGRSSWFMGGMFTFAAFAHFIWEASRAGGKPWIRAFALCILCWLVVEASFSIPGLYYDQTANYINAVMVFTALQYFLAPELFKGEDAVKSHLGQAFILCFLAACGFCVKPILALSALSAACLALFILKRGKTLSPAHTAVIFIMPILAACGWLARNIIHSGYPMYPSPFLGLDLRWTLPDYIINDIYAITKNGPRLRDGDMWRQVADHNFWFWFSWWLPHQFNGTHNIRMSIQALMPLLGGMALWARAFWGTGKARREALRASPNSSPGAVPPVFPAAFFFFWSFGNIIFWFIMAPDLRYSMGFFWVFAACAAAFAMWGKPGLPMDRKTPRGLEKLAIAGGIIFFITASANIVEYDKRTFSFTGVGRATPRPMVARRLHNGQNPPLTVFVPKEDHFCGNGVLLCTPYPEDNLKMLEPGNPGAGFYRDKNDGEGNAHRKHIIPY